MSPLRKMRYRLEWMAMEIAVLLVPLLSRRAAHQLGGWIGTVAAALHGAGRKVAFANLEAAFGNLYNRQQQARIVRESYQNFARAMVHLLWSAGINEGNFREQFDLVNLSEEVAGLDQSKGLITVTFHFGDWEAAALAMGLAGFPLLIVAQEAQNPLLDPIFTRLRERFGHQVTGRERAIVKMYKALQGGRTVAILSDLAPKTTEPFVAIDCLGLKTCVTFAHAWLHQRAGAPLVPLYCEQLHDGRRRLVVRPALQLPAAATEAQVAQACWDCFEEAVRANPGGWLWMYKHWRYKPTETDSRYPAYAGDWLKLDKHLERSSQPGRPAQQKRRRLAQRRSG